LELGDIGAFDENGLGEPAVWIARGFIGCYVGGRGQWSQRVHCTVL